MRQDFIHQQGGTICHSSRPTAGTKAASFTTERNELLVMTNLTSNPEEAMLKPSALQKFFKFLGDGRSRTSLCFAAPGLPCPMYAGKFLPWTANSAWNSG
jgi:hypothetical protein